MPHLTRSDLWSLEQYSEQRESFRAEVLAHKKNRRLSLGENARIYFEDTVTIRYQIQEMLRIEKIFEVAGIEEELAAYNPLIPDGTNWKATFMIEFGDPAERAQRLREMRGIENCINIEIEGQGVVQVIADEDLERETEEKTSAVHFMRFELSNEQIAALKDGAKLFASVEHAAYPIARFEVAQTTRDALVRDLVLVSH
ncbi:MAG: Uncharacterised protein [Halieaceae bacterium]|jgi:hypothetical protein|nr:MAG: Uncharacterised protein [Halieaceae bacterium]|tara:strand:+ start:1916 stop:2512 length:597 start_codon:yes stop_codon:yes gene_type:complete